MADMAISTKTTTAAAPPVQYDKKEIDLLLDGLHSAAAASDLQSYMSCFAPNATFLGTDATEHWTIKEFCDYAKPHFEAGTGWVYEPISRKIQIHEKVACFDEELQSPKWGEARGTGVVIMTDTKPDGADTSGTGGWKILQYHLSFPIPNNLAKEVTALIKKKEPNQSPE